ncbi:MFS general substrate transporter [Lentinus brumalis]|uniref:MFS general substrate transporter n=1 Tax=Lentinus brumalis TaxID=2498619 RepID=A0A371CVN4_9APHY|nr:MFS general substrate transporter [Polyporus brumalis]
MLPDTPVEFSASTASSPAETLTDGRATQKYSPARRYVLLIVFCLSQALDAYNAAALFPAIPSLVKDLNFTEAESTWIISGFQLTFASFLLISGRISDVYNPKFAFIGGVFALGILCLGAGFVTDKIVFIVLRALIGIAGAMTIPSALALLVDVFPEPTEQARAIAVFVGCGGVANSLGLIIGAIFVQFASWSWVFWSIAIVSMPVAAICVFLIPKQEPRLNEAALGGRPRWKSLDILGVTILTIALVLFIFAVTSGGTSGWGSARVLAPLIISILMVAGFFYYETTIPEDCAAIPPRTWFLPNFLVLFFTALLPYFWWNVMFTISTTLWQNVWHWSALSVAIHLIPNGALAFAMSFTGSLSHIFNPKWNILFGEGLCIIATTLFAFADGPEKYWPFIFPALVLGSAGAMLTLTQTNIAMCRAGPASMAGTVGAIFNGSLQLGTALGISIVGSIEVSVEATHGGPTSYAGRAASFWFLLAFVGVEFLSMLVFYHISKEGTAITDIPGKPAAEVVTVIVEKGAKFAGAVEQPQFVVTPEGHVKINEVPVTVI